jgi:hypothetical protein
MREGVTEELVQLRDRLDKVHTGQQSAIKNDGALRAAGRYGKAEPPPALNFKTDLVGLKNQLQERAPAVAAAAQWSGKTEWLYPEEAEEFGRTLNALPAADRGPMLKAVAEVGGMAAMVGLAGQLKDKNMSVAIGAMLSTRETTAGRSPAVLYFTGVDAVKQDRVKLKSGEYDNTKGEIFKALEGVYRTTRATEAAAEAAAGIWAGIKAESGENDIARAVRLATGGVMMHNGQKIAKPWGLSDDEFRAAVQRTTAADLERQGGQQFNVAGQVMTAAQLAAQLPKARLQTFGDGLYSVTAAGVPVLRADGQPLVIKIGP